MFNIEIPASNPAVKPTTNFHAQILFTARRVEPEPQPTADGGAGHLSSDTEEAGSFQEQNRPPPPKDLPSRLPAPPRQFAEQHLPLLANQVRARVFVVKVFFFLNVCYVRINGLNVRV